ncbi:ribosomal protein S6 modification protein [Aggregatibacter actinomycetemcomitans serotype e str. SC1083]|uniref:Probable alpha-L-glutamate ligase n=1 Tax=Aggregatibacter actinomycetemcomitans serotype e str. SC1083 TaxID=907488 RepID=G4AAK1_AGGAC|nr:RimK family alpha-L-glutamate ligase [Aggregatibacter actinomycetemcomitans]EGY32858.1 ribosomal protein S6 modification protein [Aggregatibacter actinomycetemcomitans serotype e str. SC1083]TYB21880.1 RimK family alpha-L-glutamate ligase [Aggregatibacter actinomycetemcomitans]
MKFLMLCREPRLYSCQRLKDAAEENGHQMDILDPNRCLIKLQKNPPHFALYYQTDAESEAQLLPHYDAVLPRFGTTSTLMGCRVLHYFQARGVPCLNNADAFRNARDKWLSLQMLLQQGVAVPDSLLAGIEVNANHAVQHIGAPTILKTLSGSQGIGVILAERAQSAVSILETLKQADVPVLLQEFVTEADGTDLRCFVIGGRVVAAMQRVGQNGEFRANCHRGATAEKVILTEQEKQIALQAAKALGLDVAGVDLIRSAKGPLVLEVNASPGLEMIEKTSGINIALQMILYLEQKIRN